MAEYLANALQNVALNAPVLFTASIPCNKGYVYHEDETGIFILRGITNNSFNGNVAIPTGSAAVTPIALSIAVNGEERPTSRAIYSPTADEFGNLTSTALITVPKGCCFSMSIRYVDATTDDPATTPTPTIEVQNANLVINRVA